jgi:hypothetical protein
MRRVVVAATVVAALVAVLAAGASARASGLRGVAVLYPARPVCGEDDPCTRPAANVVLAFWRRGVLVKRVTTTADGHYVVRLAAGVYRVTAPAYRVGSGVTPKHVRVTPARMSRVKLTIDTGIQ